MKTTLNLFILILVFQSGFGQTNFDFKGQLTDCSDSMALIFGTVLLIQNDSVIATTYTNENGRYTFRNIKDGTYQIQFLYYYYPRTNFKIVIPSDYETYICLSAENLDSLLTNFKPFKIYTIYYFGLPIYLDEELNEIGKKYGVRWQNMGCNADNRYDKYNDMIYKIMTKKNGIDWEERFWSDVKLKFDK